jgi:hypothetical protein
MPIKIEIEMKWELIALIVDILAKSEGFVPPKELPVLSTANSRATRWKNTAENILSVVEACLNQQEKQNADEPLQVSE